MGFLHPFLLAGLAAVTVPILIHLLLRQRPRPRPWAAMRWLLAASQQASRRYRLTNILLLLLRMLVVALIALAVSRPLIGGIGGGDRLVIILDRTASMGARGPDPGPLAAALAKLAAKVEKSELPYQHVVLVTVDASADVVVDANPASLREPLARVTVSALPGGLDRAARDPLLGRILGTFGGARPDVLLISDFQQDHGDALVAALGTQARQIVRWSPSTPLAPGANATVVGSGAAPDLLPGQGGELAVLMTGLSTSVTLAVDDAPAVEVPAIGLDVTTDPSAVRAVTVPVPPLPAGAHRLRVQFSDAGLAYDNLLEVPVPVRPAVPALVVGNGTITGDYLAAALQSDERAVAVRAVRPALIAAEPLAAGGLVALRTALPSAADAKRVADWVGDGGVLWAGIRVLTDDQALAPLLGTLRSSSGKRAGGPWNTGSTADKDLDALLGLAGAANLPEVTLPTIAEILLRAGEAPAVIALPAGRGWVVIEFADLATDPAWQARGATPLWALRMARRYTARAAAVPTWVAGENALATTTLKRGADVVPAVAGEPLAAAPGTWATAEGTVVVVLPNRDEGRLDRPLTTGVSTDLSVSLHQSGNADLGSLIALAALAVAVVEGLLAAWAGRAYGR